MFYVSTKLLLEKSAKTKKKYKKKTWKHLKSLADSWDKASASSKFLRPHYQTVFLKHFFLFSTPNSKMSRNMCNLRPKVRNGQNIPHESPNFTDYFFLSKFTYILATVSQIWDKITKTIFSQYFFCFLLQNPGCLLTCVFGVTNYVMPKWASVQLLHGQINLDLIIQVIITKLIGLIHRPQHST